MTRTNAHTADDFVEGDPLLRATAFEAPRARALSIRIWRIECALDRAEMRAVLQRSAGLSQPR